MGRDFGAMSWEALVWEWRHRAYWGERMLRRDLRGHLLRSMVVNWPIFIPQAMNPLGLVLLILRDRMS